MDTQNIIPSPSDQEEQIPTKINPACMESLEIDWTGNITPQKWFHHILKPTGKPDLLAILILSDIVYWYRPVEVRNKETGEISHYRQKFQDDKLQRSHQSYAKQFGVSKQQVIRALNILKNYGLISTETRTIFVEKLNQKLGNVLYIEPNFQAIKNITTK